VAAHEAQATPGEHNENCAGGAARRVEEAERASVGGPESGLPRPRRVTRKRTGGQRPLTRAATSGKGAKPA